MPSAFQVEMPSQWASTARSPAAPVSKTSLLLGALVCLVVVVLCLNIVLLVLFLSAKESMHQATQQGLFSGAMMNVETGSVAPLLSIMGSGVPIADWLNQDILRLDWGGYAKKAKELLPFVKSVYLQAKDVQLSSSFCEKGPLQRACTTAQDCQDSCIRQEGEDNSDVCKSAELHQRSDGEKYCAFSEWPASSVNDQFNKLEVLLKSFSHLEQVKGGDFEPVSGDVPNIVQTTLDNLFDRVLQPKQFRQLAGTYVEWIGHLRPWLKKIREDRVMEDMADYYEWLEDFVETCTYLALKYCEGVKHIDLSALQETFPEFDQQHRADVDGKNGPQVLSSFFPPQLSWMHWAATTSHVSGKGGGDGTAVSDHALEAPKRSLRELDGAS
mmetsp:Transcript_135251/g.342230  ORF Transcript_135251/g.342230 Transcript_135251/m.342230 type:complete len:384 (-) Transcript_135251:249-1400(-)